MPAVLPSVSSDPVIEAKSDPVSPHDAGLQTDFTTPPAPTPGWVSSDTPMLFQGGTTQDLRFQPAPLPAEWVHTGNPAPRSLPLTRSADGQLSSGLWDCPAGSFTYIFPCDEIVHILEGDVIVESQGGQRHLRVGDVAFFPQGLETRWTVRHYVKKLAIFRVVTRPLHARIAGRLRRWLG